MKSNEFEVVPSGNTVGLREKTLIRRRWVATGLAATALAVLLPAVEQPGFGSGSAVNQTTNGVNNEPHDADNTNTINPDITLHN